MSKKLIKLTESDLHRIIKESVNNILNELDHRTYHTAAMKDYDPNRSKKFQKMRDDVFNKKYAYYDENGNDVRLYSDGNELKLIVTVNGIKQYIKYFGDEKYYDSTGGWVNFPNVMGNRRFARILSKVDAAFENMCSNYKNGAYDDRHQEVDFHKFLGKKN